MPQILNEQPGKSKPYFWIGLLVLLCTYGLYQLVDDQLANNPRAFGLIYVFGAFGMLMMTNGLLQTVGERKIKKAVLDVDDAIIPLGTEFSGWVHFPSNSKIVGDAKFFLTIKNVRVSGRRQEVLWQDDGVVKAERDLRGLLVPINFVLPENLEGSDSQNPTIKVLWWLEVYCSTRGLDFTASFPLNVQRTALTIQSKLNSMQQSRVVRSPVVKFSERDLTDTVVIHEPSGQKNLDFKMLKAPSLNISIGFLGIMCCAAAALLSVVGLKLTGAFTFFASPINSLLASAGIFLIFLSLYNLFSSRSIKFMESSLVIKVKLLLFGRSKEIPWNEVIKVDVKSSGTQGTKSWYDVTVKTSKGPNLVVARQIENKVEAEWIKTTILKSKPVKKAA